MNSTPPSLPPSKSKFSCGTGCLVLFVVAVTLCVVGVLVARHVAFSTAVPFNFIATMIEKANPNVKITGITGDVATGPSVESITWGTDPAHRSEILGLRAKYNGLSDIQATKRVIIQDVGVRKAHIDLADFGPVTHTSSHSSGTKTSSSSPSSSGNSGWPNGIDSVEIQRVLFEDVLITNRNTSFQLSIPKISWTGFKVTANDLEPGDLQVESDRLVVHSGPGQTLPIGDQSVTFKKSISVTALPLLHPAIRKEVGFVYDFTFVPGAKAPAFHISAADGQVEAATTADGGTALRVKHLELSALLDAHKLYGPQAADFPSDVVLEAEEAGDDAPIKITGGSFHLGETTFEIEPAEISTEERDKAVLHAKAQVNGGEIRWNLPLNELPVYFRPTFTSTPEMPATEILSRVFANKAFADLSAEERSAVDARVPVYFPAKEQ